MRSVQVNAPGGIDDLVIASAEVPKPQSGEVLVRTVAAGVNRADLLQRRGFYPPPAGISDVLGLEASGIVEQLGDGVTGWQVGDEALALLAGGGYAEYFVVPVGQLLRPPAGVDLVTAAGLPEVAATVVSNFDHIGLQQGETILIHGGAGGIGTFATQYAAALGCRVIATAGTPAKREHCLDHGADVALDYQADWVTGVREATDGAGADVILDIIGAKYLSSNVRALAYGGRIVTIGLQGGTKGKLNLGRLLNKAGTITATSLRFRNSEAKAEICRQVEQRVWPLLASGELQSAPTTRIDFADVQQAHRLLESGEAIGKIVLVF